MNHLKETHKSPSKAEDELKQIIQGKDKTQESLIQPDGNQDHHNEDIQKSN